MLDMHRRLVVAVLVLVGSCAPSAPTADTPSESAAAKGKTLELSSRDRNETKLVSVGDRVVIVLSESSQGIAPEYRYGWGDPSVDGEGLRFIERTTKSPPDDVDGGRTRERFEFEAVSAGMAVLRIPVRDAGEEATAEDFEVMVEVRAP